MNNSPDDNRSKKEESKYFPGECNLGNKEIKRRKKQAIAGLVITILSIIIFQINYPTSIWRLLVFAPIFYTIICFLQAREKFCVVFGIYGVYNFSDVRKVIAVKEKEYRLKDRNKSIKIIFISTLIAIVITVIYFYLPN